VDLDRRDVPGAGALVGLEADPDRHRVLACHPQSTTGRAPHGPGDLRGYLARGDAVEAGAQRVDVELDTL